MILSRLRRGERIEHYETVRVTKEGRRIDVVAYNLAGAGRCRTNYRCFEDRAGHYNEEASRRIAAGKRGTISAVGRRDAADRLGCATRRFY